MTLSLPFYIRPLISSGLKKKRDFEIIEMIMDCRLSSRDLALLAKSRDIKIQQACFLCGRLGEKDHRRLEGMASHETKLRSELPYDWRLYTLEKYIQMVREEQVEAHILRVLAKIRNEELQTEVALCEDTPDDALVYLSQDINRDYSNRVFEAVHILRYAPKRFQRQDRHSCTDFDEFVLTTSVDLRLLEGLAQSTYWSDRMLAALSDGCSASLRQRLSRDSNSDVRFAALHGYQLPLKKRHLDEAEYARLLYDEVTEDVVEILANSPWHKVRELATLRKKNKSLPVPNQCGERSEIMLWWDCTSIRNDRAVNIAFAYKALSESCITWCNRDKLVSCFGIIRKLPNNSVEAYKFDRIDYEATCSVECKSYEFPGAELADLGIVSQVQMVDRGSLHVDRVTMNGLMECEQALDKICYMEDSEYLVYEELARMNISEEQACCYMSIWFDPWIFQVAQHISPACSAMEFIPTGSIDFSGVKVYY